MQSPTCSAPAQGGQHQSQQQRQPLTGANLGRLPFTPTINQYQSQDSSYERRILGQRTQAGRESASHSVHSFDAQFYGSASGNNANRR